MSGSEVESSESKSRRHYPADREMAAVWDDDDEEENRNPKKVVIIDDPDQKPADEPPLPEQPPEIPVTRKQWVTVVILGVVNLINYMDRFTIAGVLDGIMKTYDIRDDEVGLIQTVFLLSYMIFAPMFGYFGDRHSRKMLIAVGILIWVLGTVLGAFGEKIGFAEFLVSRGLVGVGQASFSTLAPTILSDMFIHNTRSRMLALFYFAIPVGSGIGYIVGSAAAKQAGSWEGALQVTPAVSIVALVLLLIFMTDPVRGESEGIHLLNIQPTSWTSDIVYLAKNLSFVFCTLGFTCVAFVAGALSWWGPHFLYLGLTNQAVPSDISKENVAYIFGIITMIAGLIGVPAGSIMGEKYRKRNLRADPLICAYGLLISTPLLFLSSVMSIYNTKTCFVLIFFGQLFLNLTWAIVADVILYVVIPTRRSTAEAIQILVSHALGDAGSPYLIGLMSTYLKGILLDSTVLTTTEDMNKMSGLASFRSLQYSICVTTYVQILGGLFFLFNAGNIIKDKMAADEFCNQMIESDADELDSNGNLTDPETTEAIDSSGALEPLQQALNDKPPPKSSASMSIIADPAASRVQVRASAPQLTSVLKSAKKQI